MAHPFTGFQKYAGTKFESYIIPIIPAGAKITEKSALTPEHLGKIPGLWRTDVKAWTGFPNWQTHNAKPGQLKWWQHWQTECETAIALGMILGDYIAADIDSDDRVVADEIEARISLEIGSSPVVRLRYGSSRRVLFYARDHLTPPIRKHLLAFRPADGQRHIVEILATGQQVIVEGPHAKGQMHYWRDGGLIEHRDWLKANLITGKQISDMMNRLGDWVDATPGMEKIKLSAPGASNAKAHKIADLMSPNLATDYDVLARCVQAIDLNDGRLADYDVWGCALHRAICAACAADMAFFGEVVLPWLRTNASNVDNDGDSRTEEKWQSFTDSQLGADFVYETAAQFGCQDGMKAVADDNAARVEEIFDALGTIEDTPGRLIRWRLQMERWEQEAARQALSLSATPTFSSNPPIKTDGGSTSTRRD